VAVPRRVYRVENAKGRGPYRGYDGAEPLPEEYNWGSEERPAPWEDCLLVGHTREQYFAFRDLHQLHKWFPAEARSVLADKGFHVGVYEIDLSDIWHGRKQVSFYKQRAKLVETITF
jgi:hypothetical protein